MLRILLVEDSPTDASLLRATISEVEAQSEIVHVECLQGAGAHLIRGAPVDVILLDLGLPDAVGLVTLETIHGIAPALPIIILTGVDDESLATEAVRRGAQDYLVKADIRPRLLLRAIQYAIERKRLEQQLRHSEERFRTLFESMTEGFALGEALYREDGKPLDFRFLEINDAFIEQSGLGREILGRPMREVLPNLEQHWIDTYCGVAQTGKPVRFENFNRDTDRHYSVFSYSPVQGRFAILFRDITEFKRTGEERERLVNQLQAILESIAEGVVIADMQGNLLTMNRAGLALHGYDSVEEIRRGLNEFEGTFELFDGEGRPVSRADSPMGRALRGEVFSDLEIRVRLKDNGKAWVGSYTGTPVTEKSGRPILAMITVKDITERKRAEESLRQALAAAEKRGRILDAIFEYLPEGLTLADAAGIRIRMVSRYGRELLGGPHNDMTAEEVARRWAVYQRDGVTPMASEDLPLVRAIRNGEVIEDCELVQVNQQGKRLPLLCSAGPIRDGEGKVVGGIVAWRDVTELKQAEQALRQSESFYRQTLESIPGMVFTTRPDGYCDYQSQPWVDFTGVPMVEHLGDGWNKLLHADDRPRAYAAWRAAVEGKAPYDLEYRVRRRDGDYEWFKVIGRPIRDESGRIVRWFGTALNINALKRTEESLELARKAAEAADRAKTEFLANMSHEIRTPMTAILGFTDLLLDHPWSESERREYLTIIRENGQMLLQLINDILDLSKIEAEKMAVERLPCVPMKILDEVTALMRVRADEKGIRLGACYDAAVPPMIYTDPIRLRQILVNLVGNAVKFTKQGKVQIQVSYQSGTEGSPKLTFAVADTGIGISAEGLATIFEPFTQADGSLARLFGGTGLGLAISRRLAKLLGGTLEATSEPGKGSVFTLSIDPGPLNAPLLTVPHLPTIPESVASPVTLRPGRILLVEDTMSGRRVIQTLLEKAGLTVDTSENGLEGCRAVFRAVADHQPYDAILMDMQMPEMDGYEATRQLRRQGWRGPIIALTAHAMEGDRAKCLASGCDDYVAKPVSRGALIEALGRFLR